MLENVVAYMERIVFQKLVESYGWEVNITFKLKKGLTLSSCVKPEQRTSKWDVKFEKWTYITFLK